MARWYLVISLALWLGCDGDRPASFSYIHAAILQPNCATSSCHTRFNAQAGVQLQTKEAAFAILVGHACDDVPGGAAPRNFVAPGEPERSRLMHLLVGDEVRRQMPPDRPLPAVDIALIEQWILEGAECD